MIIPTDALILLDTNILIHLLRGDAVGQRLVADYDLFKRPQRPLISFVTKGAGGEGNSMNITHQKSKAQLWTQVKMIPGTNLLFKITYK